MFSPQVPLAMGAEDDKNGTDVGKNDYDVTEHLMSAGEVASKYATDINTETPAKSSGLKSSEVRTQPHQLHRML